MIRVVIANQRGGVGKTTAAVNYAWYLANTKGLRTLLIDTDSQGSVGVMLNLKPKHYFSHFLVNKFHLDECTISAGKNLQVLCGNKDTVQAESALAGAVVRELALKIMLEPYETNYDAVIIDVSPSINLLQTCAMVYARNVVIPVNMDLLSLNGANAAYDMIRLLNELIKTEIQPIGLMPCQVDKAFRARKALLEHDPNGKAAQDYIAAFEKITELIEGAGSPTHVKAETTA
jgi:chromosome partitioning protein